MEYNFHPIRLAIFAACLAVFALLGGFKPLRLESADGSSAVRLDRAWSRIVLLFIVGAAASAFADHEAGTMDRTSLRWAYVLIGVVLMVTAVLWLRSIRANSVPREARFPMIAECVC